MVGTDSKVVPVHMEIGEDGSSIDDLVSEDDAAIERFVLTHMPWMTALAQRVLVDPSLAEDCVQEVFFKLLGRVDELGECANVKDCLRQIVVDQARSKLREMRK